VSAPAPGPEVFIALGANLGNARQTVLDAMELLETHSATALRRSSFWQSTPVDCPPGSPTFINAIVGLMPHPGETPESLLGKLQGLERKLGRSFSPQRNAPRTLDLDLIAFGSETRNTPGLTLPHPRFGKRRFVLAPLSELAPDLILPGQSHTVAELLAQAPSDPGLKRLE
jgi:2-amino-4-hydroxy-6-hydroxymethyldihydropteridine diphosphokinase